MQLVIDFIFYMFVYSTCFERQAPIIRSPLTVHTASSFLCLCLSAALSCKELELYKDARIQKRQTTCQFECPCSASCCRNPHYNLYYNKTCNSKLHYQG
jgi:hypothetical protein